MLLHGSALCWHLWVCPGRLGVLPSPAKPARTLQTHPCERSGLGPQKESLSQNHPHAPASNGHKCQNRRHPFPACVWNSEQSPSQPAASTAHGRAHLEAGPQGRRRNHVLQTQKRAHLRGCGRGGLSSGSCGQVLCAQVRTSRTRPLRLRTLEPLPHGDTHLPPESSAPPPPRSRPEGTVSSLGQSSLCPVPQF